MNKNLLLSLFLVIGQVSAIFAGCTVSMPVAPEKPYDFLFNGSHDINTIIEQLRKKIVPQKRIKFDKLSYAQRKLLGAVAWNYNLFLKGTFTQETKEYFKYYLVNEGYRVHDTFKKTSKKYTDFETGLYNMILTLSSPENPYLVHNKTDNKDDKKEDK